ncbi:hypothetical protein BaRGS_00024412 [Batillaria attramentaria]|uniref:Uncharacterized protein n=1 Tax=Batillaria attramentaria TaxID=370345 RepID=A0ABD0KB30_9CAEN
MRGRLDLPGSPERRERQWDDITRRSGSARTAHALGSVTVAQEEEKQTLNACVNYVYQGTSVEPLNNRRVRDRARHSGLVCLTSALSLVDRWVGALKLNQQPVARVSELTLRDMGVK